MAFQKSRPREIPANPLVGVDPGDTVTAARALVAYLRQRECGRATEDCPADRARVTYGRDLVLQVLEEALAHARDELHLQDRELVGLKERAA